MSEISQNSNQDTTVMPDNDSARPKRLPKATLPDLIEKLSENESKLVTYLEFDISSLAENSEQLKKFANNFKSDWKLFNKSSRDASTRLVEKGSTLASQEIRQKRLELQKDAQEVKVSLDQMLKTLGLDNMSSLESCSAASVQSGFSLRSQLSNSKLDGIDETYLSVQSERVVETDCNETTYSNVSPDKLNLCSNFVSNNGENPHTSGEAQSGITDKLCNTVVSSCQNDNGPLDYFQNIVPSGSHDMVTELNNVSLSSHESSPKIFFSNNNNNVSSSNNAVSLNNNVTNVNFQVNDVNNIGSFQRHINEGDHIPRKIHFNTPIYDSSAVKPKVQSQFGIYKVNDHLHANTIHKNHSFGMQEYDSNGMQHRMLPENSRMYSTDFRPSLSNIQRSYDPSKNYFYSNNDNFVLNHNHQFSTAAMNNSASTNFPNTNLHHLMNNMTHSSDLHDNLYDPTCVTSHTHGSLAGKPSDNGTPHNISNTKMLHYQNNSKSSHPTLTHTNVQSISHIKPASSGMNAPISLNYYPSFLKSNSSTVQTSSQHNVLPSFISRNNQTTISSFNQQTDNNRSHPSQHLTDMNNQHSTGQKLFQPPMSDNRIHYDVNQHHTDRNIQQLHEYNCFLPQQSSNNRTFYNHETPNSRANYSQENTHAQHQKPIVFSHNPSSQPMQNNNNLSSLEIMSNHLLEQSLMKKGIEPFDGTAHSFWPWVGKLENYIGSLNLTPLKILQLLESYSKGEPQKMINQMLAATGEVTMGEVHEVWENLTQRYGSSQKIANELTNMIKNFPIIDKKNQGEQLQKLHDVCRIISYNMPKCPELRLMDLSSGLHSVREKLPEYIQHEWGKVGQSYEDANYGNHPPFSVFVDFLKKQAKRKSNKNYETIPNPSNLRNVKVMQTNVSGDNYKEKTYKSTQSSHGQISKYHCVYHDKSGHSLSYCKAFKILSYQDKQKFVYDNKLCFYCLEKHKASDCKSNVKCNECQHRHVTAMHRPPRDSNESKTNRPQVLCTQVCQDSRGKNCSKTLLTEITMDNVPNKSIIAYCILDEQSNTTLVDQKVIEYFGKNFPIQEYSIKFASQDCEMSTSGQVVSGLQVRGVLQDEVINIPQALSCPNIADTTREVATPDMVLKHEQIKSYAKYFPHFDPNADVLLLIGRNCGRAMATQCLTKSEPYIHKSPLGYSLVGNICTQSQNEHISVMKTHIDSHDTLQISYNFSQKPPDYHIFDTFEKHHDDDLPGKSSYDRKFMSIMESNICPSREGNIQLPLPLIHSNLPDNKSAVYMRSSKTLNKLKSDPVKLDACIQSMEKNLEARFVEQVPINEVNYPQNDVWYLNVFCVEHPKKLKPRLVYDASARYHGISLNDVLYQGPDLNNQLRGVLLRFRERPIAFGADIQSMFSNFKVPEQQRDLLRFYWYKYNDPDNDIVVWRSTSHIFGCTSSPSVANCALKYCASQLPPEEHLTKNYLDKSFYVDDGMYCTDSSESAIEVLSKTITLLKQYNIRLHKIVSNSKEVLDHFPESEHATHNTKIPTDNTTNHSTLGVEWNTQKDVFVMNPSIPLKPFTKRGILSSVNSFYDPIGMSSPIVLQARLIQREILSSVKELQSYDWDDILPQKYFSDWSQWLSSLSLLSDFHVPRCFYPLNFNPTNQELHVFSDASENAIGYVAYMRSINKANDVAVCFVTASSKVAPRSATTIPRLELCAALEASRCASALSSALENKPKKIYMHCDSRIVLGYISNESRRFTKYIERRTSIILDLTSKEDWKYVCTKDNPADMASRPHTPEELLATCWLDGPSFLSDRNYFPDLHSCPSNPQESLPEEKLSVNVMHTTESPTVTPFTTLFKRVGNFQKIINITKYILKFARLIDVVRQKRGVLLPLRSSEIHRDEAVRTVVKLVQTESYPTVIARLKSGKALPEDLKLSDLSPHLDNYGIIRVGGRLKNANIAFSVKHPILLPKSHPISLSVITYFHEKNKHQGSHISHNSVIQAGFFVENGRQLIRSLVNTCVTCRKLRARPTEQLMSDLPKDRLEETSSFTHVGIDVFGPFYIHDGKNTRRTSASKKIWAIIFVCLPSRAIHLEPLYGMDTSSFRNALSRFISIRGTCRTIRSDQGTNFTCAKKQLESINIKQVSSELEADGIQWIMNPPHASHQGGTWERKIGSVRRVLESSILLINNRCLSRDEFTTFLAESVAIVNNTPLWSPSANPNDPSPLTPAMLLTLKSIPNPSPLETFSESDLLAFGQKRFKRVQYLASQFWNRWRTEYLHTLSFRHKWKTTRPCICIDDIVLIRDKQSARNSWPMGKVSEVKISQDGLVRSATIKLPHLGNKSKPRFMDRSVNDLVLLIPAYDHKCFNPA